jgi:hypothetical protein
VRRTHRTTTLEGAAYQRQAVRHHAPDNRPYPGPGGQPYEVWRAARPGGPPVAGRHAGPGADRHSHRPRGPGRGSLHGPGRPLDLCRSWRGAIDGRGHPRRNPDRRAAGTSRNGTAVAGRSPCPGCGLATTSQISPAVRSPPDRADGLPLPCALDEDSLIDAVMSVPRPQAYGACVVERAAQAHWRRPIPRPPGRWPGPAPGTAYGLCIAYLFGLVQLKQRRPGVPDREEQLGIGVAGAEPGTTLAHPPVGRLPGWSGQD